MNILDALVTVSAHIISVGGALLENDSLLIDKDSEVLGGLLNDGGKVELPLEELVVLEVDVLTSAAGLALVGLLVELLELGVDDHLLGCDSLDDLSEHGFPEGLDFDGNISEDLLSACLTGFTDVGKVLEALLPLLNDGC